MPNDDGGSGLERWGESQRGADLGEVNDDVVSFVSAVEIQANFEGLQSNVSWVGDAKCHLSVLDSDTCWDWLLLTADYFIDGVRIV